MNPEFLWQITYPLGVPKRFGSAMRRDLTLGSSSCQEPFSGIPLIRPRISPIPEQRRCFRKQGRGMPKRFGIFVDNGLCKRTMRLSGTHKNYSGGCNTRKKFPYRQDA
jgi:hypothetical protein